MRWFPALLLVATFGCGDDSSGNGGSGGGSTTTTGGGKTSTQASTTIAASSSTGLPSCDAVTCGADEFCNAGECRPCAAPGGTQHDVVLAMGDGEEDREYFLHVPAGYECAPTPLLVDFHGTAAGERPEESYQNDALVDLAEAKNAIVVRPRSRSSLEGGTQIYRWDQNPGDIARNVVFARNLVETLRSTYHVDPARTYASGFSSGSNMTSQFLGDARGLFVGLAPIAGGVWQTDAFAPFDAATAPRIYLATGYRDYLYPSVKTLRSALTAAAFPDAQIVFRQTDNGHDLYAWHFEDLWAWLDEGKRPEAGAPLAPWTAETVPTSDAIVASSVDADGAVVAATSTGVVLRRSAAGAWSTLDQVGDGSIGITGMCGSSSGRIFVAGEGWFARSDAGGNFGQPVQVPEFDGAFFGKAYLNGVACAESTVAVGGYWSSAWSTDDGTTFGQLSMLAQGYPAQASALTMTAAGTRIGVGYYDYVGRAASSADAYTSIGHPVGSDWLTDVTSVGTHVFVVGDHGTILHSADDGLTFEEQASPTTNDLYTVAFFDAEHGIAAGLHGTVVVTSDGGNTWTLVPTGLDVFFGAAHMIDADTALVLGEGGRALRAAL